MLALLALLAFLCLLWVAYWVIAYLRDEDKYSPGYVSSHQCTECSAGSVGKLGKHIHAKHAHAASGSGSAGSGSASSAGIAAGASAAASAGAGNNTHAGNVSESSGSGNSSNSGIAAGAGAAAGNNAQIGSGSRTSESGSASSNANASGTGAGASASAGNNAHAGSGSESSGSGSDANASQRLTAGSQSQVRKGSGASESSSNASNNSNTPEASRTASVSNISDAARTSSSSDASRTSNTGSNAQSNSESMGSSASSASNDSHSGQGSSSNAPARAHAGASAGASASGSYTGSSSGSGVHGDTRTSSGLTPLYTRPVGKADDLKEIYGVGDAMEGTLNDLGITTYQQLANFQDADVQKVSDALSEQNAGFGDRITRDEWVPQAKLLAAGQSNASYGGGASKQSPSGQGSGAAASAGASAAASAGAGVATGAVASGSNAGSSYGAGTNNDNRGDTRDDFRAPSGLIPLYTRPVGKGDDLKEIYGVGDVMEGTLNDLGITTFRQLANFDDADEQRVSNALSEQNSGFGNRISRDEWVPQAKLLAAGQSNASYAGNASNRSQSGQGSDSNSSKGASAGASASGRNTSSGISTPSGLTPLYTPPAGKADDLKEIHGVGDVMEGTLNELGITTYQQLAGLQGDDVQRVSDALSKQNAGFGDRITREEWVAQAKELAARGTNASYGSNTSGGHAGGASNASTSGGTRGGTRTKSGLTQRFTRPTETADDLTVIRGIGDVMEETLNDLGITTYQQLGEFQEADVNTVKEALSELHAGFGDRITRDKWVAQAKVLAARNRR